MAHPVRVPAVVSRVTRHSDTVVSYEFVPQQRVPRVRAGQFLHVALDPYRPGEPWPESRVFSIASDPTDCRKRLSITVSVKGAYTQRMIEQLRPQSQCWLKLPYGQFLFPDESPVTLVAGGVGMTPFLSFLRERIRQASRQSIALFYGIRAADLYLFGDVIEQAKETLSNFRCEVSCEEPTDWTRTGRLDIERIMADSSPEAVVYLSGPPEMITAFQKRLEQLGVPRERVRVDHWE